MKNYLLSTALASLLFVSTPSTLESTTYPNLEQRLENRRIMKGFTLAERETLNESRELISEKYILPDILFYNLGDKLNSIITTVDFFGISHTDPTGLALFDSRAANYLFCHTPVL